MSESNHNTYRGPLGPAEQMQFPLSYREGTVQIAESYTEPGTDIVWENHPQTSTTDPDVTARRLAIITDSSNNVHFLSGNVLYDLGASKREGTIISVELSDDAPMPDLMIGQPSIFTSGATISSALIATERVRRDDPSATNVLANSTRQAENPFVLYSRFIQGLNEPAQQRSAAGVDWSAIPTVHNRDVDIPVGRRLDQIGAGKDISEFWPDDEVIAFRYARVYDARKPGRVIPATSEVGYQQGKDYPEYKRGWSGRRISPSVEDKPGNTYEPRRGERIRDARLGLGSLAAEAATQVPGPREIHGWRARKAHQKAENYWRKQPTGSRPPEFEYLDDED
jgi:hypothetical protein